MNFLEWLDLPVIIALARCPGAARGAFDGRDPMTSAGLAQACRRRPFGRIPGEGARAFWATRSRCMSPVRWTCRFPDAGFRRRRVRPGAQFRARFPRAGCARCGRNGDRRRNDRLLMSGDTREEMELMRHFWDAARRKLDGVAAANSTKGVRFPLVPGGGAEAAVRGPADLASIVVAARSTFRTRFCGLRRLTGRLSSGSRGRRHPMRCRWTRHRANRPAGPEFANDCLLHPMGPSRSSPAHGAGPGPCAECRAAPDR